MLEEVTVPVLLTFLVCCCCGASGGTNSYFSNCIYNIIELDCNSLSLLRVPSCSQLIDDKNSNSINIDSFNKHFASLPCYKIARIDLSNNRITAIESNTMKDYLGVKSLNFEHNELDFIDSAAFELLTKLQVLHLSYNKLKSTKFQSSSLIYLEMTHCLLDTIELQYVPALLSVDLDNNNIKEVERNAFTNNPNLHSIILSNNEIEVIDNMVLRSLSKLSFLNLSFNKIKKLPDYLWIDAKGWLTVDLSNNQIYNIDWSTTVHFLNLSSNRISFIEPDVYRHLPTVESLDLSNNAIQSIPNLHSDTLSTLILRNNSINYLGSDTTVGLPNLTYLDLSYNKLKHPFEPFTFRSNPNLLQIYLGNNPWACKCWSSSSFHHLFKFVTKPPRKLADGEEVVCFTPKKWRGLQWDQACSKRWNSENFDMARTDLIAIFLISTIVAVSSGCLGCLLLIRFFPTVNRTNNNPPRVEPVAIELREIQKPPSFEEALSMPLLTDEAQLKRPLTDSEKTKEKQLDHTDLENEPPDYEQALKGKCFSAKEV